MKGILQVFEGGNLNIKDKFSFDLLAITFDKDWEALNKEFLNNSEKFFRHLEQIILIKKILLFNHNH